LLLQVSAQHWRTLCTAISWASQTALRDVIGKTMLSDMLEGRDKISSVLQKIIAVESMQLGGLAGLTALTMGLGQERANGQKEAELKRET
jgi:regulator of protease activity HflC (stomatin/prohibitin superfamily)